MRPCVVWFLVGIRVSPAAFTNRAQVEATAISGYNCLVCDKRLPATAATRAVSKAWEASAGNARDEARVQSATGVLGRVLTPVPVNLAFHGGCSVTGADGP